MNIQFLGAARTVTGSMHLVTVNGHRLLLDCGLFQGRRAETWERNRTFPFNVAELDAVVLSHAHIDHSGNLPNLVKAGFHGCVYATSATRDLCAAMLPDSGHIQESDTAYVNKKRARQNLPPVEPLYTRQEAIATLSSFHSLEYGHTFMPVPGVKATFLDAGHILGSAITVLDLDEGGRRLRLAFTGDLGRKGLPILRDPAPVEGADALIVESTYGARTHETPDQARDRLVEITRETQRRGGKLLIPAFAVGRTQEIVYGFHRLFEAGALRPISVYVDSPLAINVTEAFRLHPECYDADVNDFLLRDSHNDPFGFGRLTYVRDVEDSKALNTLDKPAIIIAASGMCEGGRILHHLRHNIEDPRTCILFPGFQAENTLGRRLVDGEKKVRIFGEEFRVRARVEQINGYSAHADRDELLGWTREAMARGPLKRAFVVHGDETNAFALAQGLQQELGIREVVVPERGQEVEL
ncbi:MAG: MBL fold metallo-hydrolase [Anaerolineae bacterium]|nr:MBL fold metallo-hydrolase [Anaerolineae bacterium]